tara:strand:+ start:411 stop:965 length:555 start_codon:yes stop_codon:yes gene_type:complete
MINGIKLKDSNLTPNQRRIRLKELSGIPLTERDKKRILNETVSMVEIPKNRTQVVPKKPQQEPYEDEFDLDEVLREMGFYDDEEDIDTGDFEEDDIREYVKGMVEDRFHENMSDIQNITEEELDSIINGLEDDTVNEFNFNSKGYKEGRKLVDKLRRDLFKKLSDDDLDEFMNVLSNSFDLVRK